MANDNVTLVREFLAALDEWDFDGMRERLHDIVLDTLANDPGTVIATYKNEFTITASGYLYKNDLIVIFKIVDNLIATFDERLDAIPLVIASGGSVAAPG